MANGNRQMLRSYSKLRAPQDNTDEESSDVGMESEVEALDEDLEDLSKKVQWVRSLEELSNAEHCWGTRSTPREPPDPMERMKKEHVEELWKLQQLQECRDEKNVVLLQQSQREKEEKLKEWILQKKIHTMGELQKFRNNFPEDIKEPISLATCSSLGSFKTTGEGQLLDVYKLADKVWKETLQDMEVSRFVHLVNQLQGQREEEGLLCFLRSLTVEVEEDELQIFLKGQLDTRIREEQEWKEKAWTLHLVESPTSDIFDVALPLPSEKEVREKLMRLSITHDKYSGKWCFCHESCESFNTKLSKLRRCSRNIQKYIGFHRIALSVGYSISPAKQLFMCDDHDLAVMLRELTNAGSDSKVFTTTFACCLVLAAKARVRHHFKYVIANDLLFIILLGFVAFAVRTATVPGTMTVVLMGASTACLLWKAIDRIMFYMITLENFGCLAVKTSLYTMVLLSIEVLSIGLVMAYILGIARNEFIQHSEQFQSWEKFTERRWKAFWAPWEHKVEGKQEVGYFADHPNLLAVLILCRWAMFISSLQLFESVGRNVVPLAHAVTRPASLIFLLFLTCSLLATFHAYFVFPLHQETSLDTVLDRLIDMFRLEMLSDFDLDELQNRHRNVTGNISIVDHEFTGSLRHGGERQYQGIRVGFVLISLSLSVVAMNTYIGLLGELYTEAVQKKNQIYNNYLATVLWPHLSMRHRSHACCSGAEATDCEDQDKAEACWMFYDRSDLFDGCDPESPGARRERGERGSFRRDSR